MVKCNKRIILSDYAGWVREFLFTLREIQNRDRYSRRIESQRRYRRSQKGRIAWKKYYSENRQKFLDYQKNYRLKNPDKIKKIWKKVREKPERKIYSRNYLEKYLETENGKSIIKKHRRLRKAKIKKIKEVFTQEEWEQKIEKTKGFCPSCSKFVGRNNLTLDHIFPISKAEEGRIYTIDDVQPLCHSCNSSKYNH